MKNNIICIALALSSATSCKRQHIYSQDLQLNEAKVWVDIDWDDAEIEQSEINNVSVYAYPEDDSAPYLRISGDISEAYINLPVGTYSLLILNDAVGDISDVDFVDADSYSGFMATIIQQSSTDDLYYDVQSGEVVALEPGQVAVGVIDGVVITDEMISCGYCDDEDDTTTEVRYELSPTATTRECVVTLRIENLNNAYIVEGVITGFASGAYLASGNRYSNETQTTLYAVELSSKSYDTSEQIDGTIEGQCTTFGKSSNASEEYEITLSIILNSGELTTYTRDITSAIAEQDGTTIYIDLTDIDNQISLPEYTGTGFGVESWGDNSPIELL